MGRAVPEWLTFAQEVAPPPGTAGLPTWAQYGLAGLFFLAFVTGQVIPGYLYKSLKEELREEREQAQRRTLVFEEKVLPALLEASSALREATELIRDIEADRKAELTRARRRTQSQ